MASILDIADLSETVTVRGIELDVRGLGLDAVIPIVMRFPQVKKWAEGEQLESADFIAMAAAAVPAVIAACVGKAGDADVEKVAARLTIGEQIDILEVVKRLTMPEGVAPFVAKLSKLLGSIGGNESAEIEKLAGKDG